MNATNWILMLLCHDQLVGVVLVWSVVTRPYQWVDIIPSLCDICCGAEDWA